MKHKRYDDKYDILRLQKKLKELEIMAERSPYTAILTLFVYTLWKDYHYSQAKLVKFCEDFLAIESEYYEKPDSEIEKLNNELDIYAGWLIEAEVYSEKNYPRPRNAFERDMIKRQIVANNRINSNYCRCIVLGFKVLMNDGFKKQKLSNVKDKINGYIYAVTKEERDRNIMNLWQEILDGAGVYIERPSLEVGA